MKRPAHPQGRSKTDLRRGEVTRKIADAPQAPAKRRAGATSGAEQAFLFDENGMERGAPGPRHFPHGRTK